MNIRYIYLLLTVILISSCEKAIDVAIPKGKFTNELVYNTDDLAQAGMRGIYASMVNALATNPFQGSLSGPLGLLSDEFVRATYNSDQQLMLDNNLSPSMGIVSSIWNAYYNYILQTNIMYESAERSSGLSGQVKNSLMAEARFVRALCFFYMTNLYGDIPLTLTSDYELNRVMPVSDQGKVYAQVVADLIYARDHMTGNSTAPGFRHRPTKWSAEALLARVYLYQKNWAAAEQSASNVIGQSNIFKMESLDNAFLTTSSEAIWALVPAGTNLYTGETNVLQGPITSNGNFRFSAYSLQQFETGDQRYVKWTKTLSGTTAPYKFKTYANNQVGAKAEAAMILRLAEQYLIRAEARAMQDNLAGAIADIDVIRTRAGAVPNNTGANAGIAFKTIALSNPTIAKTDLIKLIYKERMCELFGEFGHRWFDAKRAGSDLATFFEGRKPAIQPGDAYFPVPEREMLFNPNIDQRDDY